MLLRVAILIENSRSWGRGLIRGIAKYSRLNGPWNFWKPPAFFVGGRDIMTEHNKELLEELEKFHPDAILMREIPCTQEIIKMGKPVVVSPYLTKRFEGVISMVENCQVTGQMAAEHLLSKGLRNFAFCGYNDIFWSQERSVGFCDYITRKGYPFFVYSQPKGNKRWESEKPFLTKWLISLPKPKGIMCCVDERSEQVAEICKAEGLHVPEEIALLGVDNDEIICDLATPPLSSISLDPEGVGFQAARMLDDVIKRRKVVDTQDLLFSPTYVVQRQSTEIMAIKDPDVSEAITFITKKAGRPITVEDVLQTVMVPRRTLERRFHTLIGNSIYQEIQNERIKRVERLLLDTTMTVAEISHVMEFSSPNELTRFFTRKRKISPTAFRKKHKKYVIH